MDVKPTFILCVLATALSLSLTVEAKKYELWRYKRDASDEKGQKSSSEEHKNGHGKGQPHGEGHKIGVHHADGHSGKLKQNVFGDQIRVQEHGTGHNGQQGGHGGYGSQGGQQHGFGSGGQQHGFGNGGQQHGGFGGNGGMNGHLKVPNGRYDGTVDSMGKHFDRSGEHHGPGSFDGKKPHHIGFSDKGHHDHHK